jgi:hypothetical protein
MRKVPPFPPSVLSSNQLATVISCAEYIIHAQWLSETLAHFLKIDDVICAAFIDLLLIIPAKPECHPTLHSDTEEWLLQKGITIIISQEHNCQIPQGPYYVEQGGLYQISKLYPDTQEAFIFGTTPSKDTRGRQCALCYHQSYLLT